MNELYKIITSNYNVVNNKFNLKPIIKQFDKNNRIITLDNLYDSDSYIGKEYIKLKKHFIYNIKIKNVAITINFYTYNDINEEILNRSIKRILTMFLSFYDKIKTNKITFHLFLYYAPRVIIGQYNKNPNEFEYINKASLFNCINGWFFRDTDQYEIVVTRLNNCLGLLTHELCHMCGLDFGGYSTFQQWKQYHQKYISNNSGEFTEGINNAISTVIHALFLNLENNSNHNYLYEEIKYSYKLCQKLIKYFKCNTLKELLDKKIYNQNSQVFEYIILRHIYLKYIDSLFHLKYKNNKFIERFTINKYYDLFISLLEKEYNNITNYKKNNETESMEYYKYDL